MTLTFKRDLQREEHGRTYNPWAGRFSGYAATLAKYFRPGSGYYSANEAGVFHDASRACGPLSYETQCETVDVLHALIKGNILHRYNSGKEVKRLYVEHVVRIAEMEREGDEVAYDVLRDLCVGEDLWPEDMILGANSIVQFLAWRSRNSHHAHHPQSIEGDYELFDQYEMDWLRSQVGTLPRRWTRSGLLMVYWSIEQDYEAFIDDITQFSHSMTANVDDPRPTVLPSDIGNAKLFLDRLRIEEDDMHPILADFFV